MPISKAFRVRAADADKAVPLQLDLVAEDRVASNEILAELKASHAMNAKIAKMAADR